MKHGYGVVVLAFILLLTISTLSGITWFSVANSNNQFAEKIENSPSPTITQPPPTLNPTPALAPTLTPSPTLIPVPVDFKVNVSSHFTISVGVDLNNGMSREEAVLVAQKLFDTAHNHATYELKSAEVNNAGVWTVSLPWGSVSPDGTEESHTHVFVAVIDPDTRTAEYSTCM